MTYLTRRKVALQKAIEGEQEQLRGALHQLKASLQQEVAPGAHAARRPYTLLGTAFAVGFFLGCWPRLHNDEQPSLFDLQNLWKSS